MSEVETNVPLPFYPRDWMLLDEAVRAFVTLFGGERNRGLSLGLVNGYLQNAQLKSMFVSRKGAWKPLKASDWGPGKRTVHATFNAEGVWVEPYEDGVHFVGRADFVKLTSPASEPAASAFESSPPPSEPKHSAPAPPSRQVEPETPPKPKSVPAVLPTVNRGGRPTDRDLVLGEADWRLRHQQTKAESLAAFARELREWLTDHGKHRTKKTGDVMQANTIERHIRPLWSRHR